MQGQIVKIISNLYTVKMDNELVDCRARGKFRNEGTTPLVGDYCIIDKENNYILEILPRKNSLKRPMIANVDCALIVTSVKKPDLSLNLLDKLLSLSLISNITPVICLTKLDLLNKEELKEVNNIIKYYQKIGFKVLRNTEKFKLKMLLKNKLIVLAGQTGAGKSSLLNRLNKKLNLETNEISEALGRGKHTTRHVEVFKVGNMYIADTPGFSSLDLDEFNEEDIKRSFIEFSKYNCYFNDCKHIKEKNCGVIKALKKGEILESRYNNYLSFINK